jgi:hypothetical protein
MKTDFSGLLKALLIEIETKLQLLSILIYRIKGI